MSNGGRSADISAILYLLPFVASGVYGLFLWVRQGISALLPTTVYLTVTRDPTIFAVGTLAVLAGVVVELRGIPQEGRKSRLFSLGGTLQSLAAASLVLTLVAALYANGFDISAAADDFVVGRYGIIFPAMLVLFSYLATAQFTLQSLRNPKTLGIIAMLLVPVSIYEIGKRQLVVGLGIALLLLVVGVAPFVMSRKRSDSSAKTDKTGQ